MLRKHPHSLKLRQLVPPVGIVGVGLGLIVGVRWRPALIVPAVYAAALVTTARSAQQPARTTAALATTHTAWVSGLVRGFAAGIVGR